MKIALCFSQFGPYHHARAAALRELVGEAHFIAVQIAAATRTYAWKQEKSAETGLRTLCAGAEEDAEFIRVYHAAARLWREEKVTVALLPSYSPASSLALLLSAKRAGVRCVMMNESHAGTEKARGLKRLVKRYLVSLFDGGLVGGGPQVRHFINLGMAKERLVTGYDAVDNRFFAEAARKARKDAVAQRARLGLPSRYILSLGRMVPKKNLECLIDAFAYALQEAPNYTPRLVFVGSGDCQEALVQRCRDHRLSVNTRPDARNHAQDVLFYGFRQIEENPVFYALADAFILPSLYEEWGLVVNEAMACGLPVLVSDRVGSAEDLVHPEVNGYHFSPRDPKELGSQLLKLEANPELSQRMGRASEEIIAYWGCERFARQAVKICTLVCPPEGTAS